MRGAGHQVLSGEPFRRTPPPPGGRGGLDGFAAVTRAEAPAAGTGATEGDRRTHLVVAGAIGALVTAVYTVFSLRQWDRFEVPSWDLGIFTQVLRGYSELSAPVVSIKGEGFMIQIG